jgi:dihydrofolate reductase
MPFKIIVAKDEKGGIGLNNKLPWRNIEDMKRFVSLTRGNGKNAVLMGRNTWESLPTHPLVGRHNLVLSKSAFEFSSNNVFEHDEGRITLFKDTKYVIEYIKSKQFEDVWIIGGEKLYSEFINEPELNKLVKEVYVTELAGDYGCDTFFNKLDSSQYEEISCGEKDKVKFKVYRNKMYSV